MLLALALTLFGGVSVALVPEAHVRGTELLLRDVARIESGDAALAERLGALSLGYAPAPGYSRVLNPNQLAQVLARSRPGLELRFSGAPACRVWPVEERIAAARLRETAEAHMRELVQGHDASYELVGTIADALVPQGQGPAALVAHSEPAELRSGTLSVPVALAVDGQTYRTVWTSWKVQLYDTLPVLKRAVGAGERLGPELFENRRVAVGSAGAAKALTAAMVVGAQASRNLAAGALVTALDVHRPTVITVGDAIFLDVRKGGIRARTAATARESGAIGDRIRVHSQQRGNEVSAVVVGRDLVEIDLGS
jgi:flagella basal body P-ring formation protein FlgA